jgi:hypothetical protein
MKNSLLGLCCLLALTVGAAPRVSRPPRAPMPVQIPVTGQALGADGRTYSFSGVVTLNVGEAPLPTPTPTPTPTPVPIPGPGVSVDRVTDASGASITSSAGGSIIYIRGSGMGAGGIVKVAGQACSVIDYAPWQVVVKLPVVATNQAGPVMVAPTGLQPATSGFAFTIIASVNPAPVPTPTPTPTPVPTPTPTPTPQPLPPLVEWPPGSGLFSSEGHLPFGRHFGPTGSWSQKRDTYPPPFFPPYPASPGKVRF